MVNLKKPCGIFWDIENVAVPRSCSADAIARNIRSTIVAPYQLEEREFFCVCNVHQLPKMVGNSLESIGVTIVQPFYEVKENAADTKILLLISKFIKNWGSDGCAIVVVTGDSDFIDTLINLKLSYDVKVYLIHPKSSFSKELLWCADESYSLNGVQLTETTPILAFRGSSNLTFIRIYDLPNISTGQCIVKEIDKRCQRSFPGSRVVRITKETLWIGYTCPFGPMAEKEFSFFNGHRIFGYPLKAEIVNNLGPEPHQVPQFNLQIAEPTLEQVSRSVQISFNKKKSRNNRNNHFHPYHRPKPVPKTVPKKLLNVKISGLKCKNVDPASPLMFGLEEFCPSFIKILSDCIWLSFQDEGKARFAMHKICTYELGGFKLTAKLAENLPDDVLSNSNSKNIDLKNNNVPGNSVPVNVPSSSSCKDAPKPGRPLGAQRILIQTINEPPPKSRPTLIDLTSPPLKPKRIQTELSDFIPLVDLTLEDT